jgi:hypothetical protein
MIIAALLLPFTAFSQYKLSNSYLNYDKQVSYTYENLRLYPIMARDSFKLAFKNISKFTSLKQALEQKKIMITEKGNGGTVNMLTVENKSKDTIIINCGEVIKGGQQDRVINEDLVLYPHSGKKDLSVFCVEHGRWSTRVESLGNRGTVRNSVASFDSYSNFSAVSLRKVVEKEKDQAVVWNKVSEINTKNKTENSTGTYTALDQSSDYNAKIKKYISSLQPKINALKDIVGVIVVSGDKVLGADIFATHDLFIQNFEGLLYSYATEAILNGKAVTIALSTVDKYVNDLLSDEKRQDDTLKKKGSKFVNKGNKLRISTFE